MYYCYRGVITFAVNSEFDPWLIRRTHLGVLSPIKLVNWFSVTTAGSRYCWIGDSGVKLDTGEV